VTRVLRLAAALAAALLALTACRPAADATPPPPPPPSLAGTFSGTNAWRELEAFLEVGPRDAGSPGAARAAAYLAERLRTLGLDPMIDSFTNATPDGPLVLHNVMASIPGRARGECVLLLSHFDTKAGIGPGFAGANDSGSSTALLLALVGHLGPVSRLPCDVHLAFVDGEECRRAYGPADGLHGSRHLARRADTLLPGLDAVIVLDMIGDRDLYVTIPRNSDRRLAARVFAAAERMGHRRAFGLTSMAIIDDHVPFLEAGIPAINLIDFEYGSAPGLNDYWHTLEDTTAHMSPRSLETVGRVVLAVLEDWTPL
jgi:glutaminyl-peptide cyclotransferase